MAQRVFVKVLGFSPTERHALNTLFRLSEQHETVYSLWEPLAPEAPRLALVDGRSEEAREHGTASDPSLKLIWIGAVAPASCWRSFDRPLSWPDVIGAMDELFAEPPAIELDLDLDFDGDAPPTLPPVLSDPPAAFPRALIASGDRDQRLYLRARLALADLTQVDEAQTGAEALALARAATYCVALVDFALPDVDGWTLMKALKTAQPGPLQVILTKAGPSLVERLRARWNGAAVLLGDPPQPASLRSALQKVARQQVRVVARR
jgi:CheY-like chemotaxis protein